MLNFGRASLLVESRLAYLYSTLFVSSLKLTRKEQITGSRSLADQLFATSMILEEKALSFVLILLHLVLRERVLTVALSLQEA